MSEKPRLTLADAQAYERAKNLRWHQKVTLEGKNAWFGGVFQTGEICFRISGRNQKVPPGDPRLLKMELYDEQ